MLAPHDTGHDSRNHYYPTGINGHLENLAQIELTQLFSVLGFTECQYRFKGRYSPGKEQKVANPIIDISTVSAMEYRHLMKDYQQKILEALIRQ